MKTLTVLVPALTACLLPAGCGPASAPKPSLSSTYRSERLEAVRNAQDQYGVRPAPDRSVSAVDRAAIVGRWNNPWTDGAYYQFNADGTAQRVTLVSSQTGTYRFLSWNAIALEFPDAWVGRHEEMSFRLRGDTLELFMLGAWVAYKRAQP